MGARTGGESSECDIIDFMRTAEQLLQLIDKIAEQNSKLPGRQRVAICHRAAIRHMGMGELLGRPTMQPLGHCLPLFWRKHPLLPEGIPHSKGPTGATDSSTLPDL
jgi:hypothetical protein